jgi:hypothetical protein
MVEDDNCLAMSTMNVRIYLSGDIPDAKIAEVPVRFPTHGATNRIAAVLICEKEGLDELLRAEGIPDRYDVALMSTKGSRHWPPAIWPSPSTSLASPFTT